MSEVGPWIAIAAAAAVCYGWRALGVALSHGLDREGAVVRWLTCVSYAMLAAVSARIVVLPSGALVETPDTVRYGACALALATFLVFRKNVIAGTGAGFVALVGLNLWGGLG